jgi:glycerate dehydrogenase
MHAVFLDFATVSYGGDLDPQPLYDALPGLVLYQHSGEQATDARLADAEVVLTNKVRISRERIAASPRLRLVGLTATGTNNVDLDAARERNIAVVNIRDYCTASVVQHVYALLLALTHRVREYDAAVKRGDWAVPEPSIAAGLPIRELAGRTLGIVGHGVLGAAVARVGEAFGLRVLLANRPGGSPQPGRVALGDLLAEADVVSLHCPLTPATRHLIGAAELARMKPGAVLINTARGGLVDAQALVDALRAERLGGAGIDVLETEPPVGGNPLLAPDVPNLIVTPHVAWGAREARQRALAQLAANVADVLRGGSRGRVA